MSDPELIRRMQAGDESAFVLLYRRHCRPLYGFALHMSGRPSLAEEALQEVFMFLIQQPEKFDADRGSLRSFLYGVTRNVVRRLLERQPAAARAEGPDLVDSAPTPLAALARDEEISSVRNAVLSLPQRYREAVVLCDLQELSYREAARTIGCNEGTIRSRLHRGRGLLRQKLTPGPDGGRSLAAARPAEGIL